MVSLHLISNKRLLSSVLEKKLAIALKTLLVLEATAKVVLIVKAVLIQKGTSTRLHLRLYLLLFSVSLGLLAANYTLCGEDSVIPPSIYITDWHVFSW